MCVEVRCRRVLPGFSFLHHLLTCFSVCVCVCDSLCTPFYVPLVSRTGPTPLCVLAPRAHPPHPLFYLPFTALPAIEFPCTLRATWPAPTNPTSCYAGPCFSCVHPRASACHHRRPPPPTLPAFAHYPRASGEGCRRVRAGVRVCMCVCGSRADAAVTAARVTRAGLHHGRTGSQGV